MPAPRPSPDGGGLHWRARGACVDLDPELFFPDSSDPATQALAACAGCPVRTACLSWALTNGETHGVWGGMTETDRLRTRFGTPATSTSQRSTSAATPAVADATADTHQPPAGDGERCHACGSALAGRDDFGGEAA